MARNSSVRVVEKAARQHVPCLVEAGLVRRREQLRTAQRKFGGQCLAHVGQRAPSLRGNLSDLVNRQWQARPLAAPKASVNCAMGPIAVTSQAGSITSSIYQFSDTGHPADRSAASNYAAACARFWKLDSSWATSLAGMGLL